MYVVAGKSISTSVSAEGPPRATGKFIFVGREKLYVRGVTYGPFRPDENGSEYGSPELVERDFSLMLGNGVNAVRTYTVPPVWLLDIAQKHGLLVMVGLSWEQHVAFLDDKNLMRSIENRVRSGVRACAGHPAVLCYTVGNEIPANIVRWHGRHRVQRFIERLYRAAKAEDPNSLVTYVNYPSTEYLQLPFLDVVCFNVFLESRDRFESYLARLQNIAADRPLIITEIGLASCRNGIDAQAKSLNWQIRAAFTVGCAGTFVFSWTDEWHRGGFDINGWGFGVTSLDRSPKPALKSLREAYAELPVRSDLVWPSFSVVVCTHNGSRTIRGCLESLKKLEYRNYEVIVVDDGSMDGSAAIAREYGVKLIETQNHGLSSARNTGLEAARGEIVAYIDDDVRSDPHWLTYLAYAFINSSHAAIGGPNIPPPDDSVVAQCVANAPGAPVHVLLTDWEAEHIPGCNMAFRRQALQTIGGFDPQFRIAGDDVDVCWRLQQKGWTLGFSPAAMVWHHRRNSIRAYWKQQLNYGKAEALLQKKWPEKYNALGHLTWRGRLYGNGHSTSLLAGRWRIYHGTWGSGLFQSIYHPRQGILGSLPMIPEGYFLTVIFAALSALGFLWKPLLLALPFFAFLVIAPIFSALLNATNARLASQPDSWLVRLRMRALIALLHLLQPLARLVGRLSEGISPLRKRAGVRFSIRWARGFSIWEEHWKTSEARIQLLETALKSDAGIVLRGGGFDRWDLEVRNGILGSTRICTATEEHGAGRQVFRVRTWPRCSRWGMALIVSLSLVSYAAALHKAGIVAGILGTFSVLVALILIRDCGTTAAAVAKVLRELGYKES